MNVYAKFDEIPSMILQDIKETKRYRHTVGRSVGQRENGRVHTITKKHYIPESTLIYQKALRKHMQGGSVCPVYYYFMCVE